MDFKQEVNSYFIIFKDAESYQKMYNECQKLVQ